MIGLAAVFGSSGVIASTGAFSSVEAQRTFNVSTTGDSSPSLGLTGNDGDIVSTETINGNQVLTLNNTNINERSVTTFDNGFTVTNNGSDDVDFYVENTGVEVQDSGGKTVKVVDFLVSGSSIVGSNNGVSVTSGSSVDVSIVLDITADGINGSDLVNIESITFVANSV